MREFFFKLQYIRKLSEYIVYIFKMLGNWGLMIKRDIGIEKIAQ